MKKYGFLFMTLFFVFFAFLYLFSLNREERQFYDHYQRYFENERVSALVSNVSETPIDPTVYPDAVIELYFPSDNWGYQAALLLDDQILVDSPMLTGHFFEEDQVQVVLGKQVYDQLTTQEKSTMYVSFDGVDYPIQGVLAESPFDHVILFNGQAQEVQQRFLTQVEFVTISSAESVIMTQMDQLLDLLQATPSQVFVSGATDRKDFQHNYDQFKQRFAVLILFSMIAFVLQCYQQYDALKLNIGVRKLVGASRLAVLRDSFIPYALCLTLAFVSSVSFFVLLSSYWFMALGFSVATMIQSVLYSSCIFLGLFCMSGLVIALMTQRYTVKDFMQAVRYE
ncbi:hypothetical protein [Enterococcus sp.]|uniref:hypothetical protein n=1 Tax=Enterococcus sp. TaxID=35783 RepID=UPI0028A133C1|nr:hypothetical protein [Enterococcus sp.]